MKNKTLTNQFGPFVLVMVVVLLSASRACGNPAIPIFNFDDPLHRAAWQVTSGNLLPPFTSSSEVASTIDVNHVINTAASPERGSNPNLTGVIQSPPFQVRERFYTILAGGELIYDKNFISIIDATSGKELWRAAFGSSSGMTTSVIDLSRGLGRMAVVRVEDHLAKGHGNVLFGGLFRVDQEHAQAELVKFHIHLLLYSASRQDGKDWLWKNLHKGHLPLLQDAISRWNNVAVQRFCIAQMARFPSASSAPALIHAATHSDPQTARYAAGALGDIRSTLDHARLLQVEKAMTQLMNKHPDVELRIIAAGTLAKLNTPTANKAVRDAIAGASPNTVGALQFIIDSENFTRTKFNMPERGNTAASWLKGMQYNVFLPRQWTPGKEWPLLVVVHGTWGNGHFYAGLVQDECNRLGAVAIAPTFDAHRFWGFGHFGGKWRSDLALIEIIQHTAKVLHLKDEPIVMVGHSEGAQFVSRFVLVHPSGVKRAAISGTDELARPDNSIAFPFGTGPNPDMVGGLPPLSPAAWLKVPTLLIVGTNDHKANIKISEKWAADVNQFAKSHGIPERLPFIKNEGGVHSLRSNYPRIRDWLARGFDD